MTTPLKHHIAERYEMTTVNISNAAGLDERYKAVQAMNEKEPLVWAFKKVGDTITGTYVQARYVNQAPLLWLRDAKGITHRVSLARSVADEFFKLMGNKHFDSAVIISIKFIGVDKSQFGAKMEAYKLIIDQPEVYEPLKIAHGITLIF
jgi:hypothetical protein